MFVVQRAAGRRSGIIHQNFAILIGGNNVRCLPRAKAGTGGLPNYGLRFCSASIIFLSVLYWLSAYTAQIVAGIQPISVICKIMQITPAIGLPIVKNVSQGNISEMRSRITFLTSVPGRSD